MILTDAPTPDLLRRLLSYDAHTGMLFWKPRDEFMFSPGNTSSAAVCKVWNIRYANKEAFTASNKDGYKVGAIGDKIYRAHRIAWAIHYGEWPIDMLDHINGDRSDNRIINLRNASNSDNQHNRKPTLGASKLKGVSWDKSRKLWTAKIHFGGRTKNLGRFESEERAHQAYCEAANVHFGEFSRTA